MDDLPDLGLFPLDLVVLPGEAVPLHLFEPRYRQLYADCVLEERPFVVVQAGPAGTAEVGCSCGFETLVRRFPDGRLNVVVRGLEPVRLVEETEGRLYFSAKVEPLGDLPSSPPPELAAKVLRQFRELAGLPEDAAPAAPEGIPLSYAVASAVELPPGPKQELLESRDEADRLTMVAGILAAVDQEIRHARLAAERAAGNGRVATQ
jgi:Lon protease-like protein